MFPEIAGILMAPDEADQRKKAQFLRGGWERESGEEAVQVAGPQPSRLKPSSVLQRHIAFTKQYFGSS